MNFDRCWSEYQKYNIRDENKPTYPDVDKIREKGQLQRIWSYETMEVKMKKNEHFSW